MTSSDRPGVALPSLELTRRQVGRVAALGGLLLAFVGIFAYRYVEPFTPRFGPLPNPVPFLVIQAVAGLLLAAVCLSLPEPVRATRTGAVGRYLSAGSFVLVALYPVLLLSFREGMGVWLLWLGLGLLGFVGLAAGMPLLARRLEAVGILSGPEAAGLALSIPLAVVIYGFLVWLVVHEILTPILSNPLFGPTLFLAPLGLAWVLVGYRIGRSTDEW